MNGRSPGWMLIVATLLVCVLTGVVVGLGRGSEALVLVAGAIIVVWASREPWIAIGVFMAVTSLFGSVSIVGLGGLPDLTVTRLMTLWIVVLAVSRWGSKDEDERGSPRKRFIARVTVLSAALFALGIMAAMRSSALTTGLQLYLDQIVVPLGLFIIAARADLDEETVRKVLLVVIALGVVWSGIGLYEFATGRSLFAAGGILRWARESYARVGGPFINPAGLGTAIGISLVVLAGSVSAIKMRTSVRSAILAFCVIGLAVTLTRGSWLAVVLGILVTGLLMGLRGVVAWMGAALASAGVGYVLLQFVGQSALIQRLTGEGPVFNRLIVYVASFRLIADNPWLGVGFGMFASAIRPYMGPVGNVGATYGIGVFAPHNSLLHAASEMGVIGVVMLISVWASIMFWFLSGSVDQTRGLVGVVGPAVVSVYVTNALFIDMWLTQNLNPLVYLLLGVMCAVAPGRVLVKEPIATPSVDTAAGHS